MARGKNKLRKGERAAAKMPVPPSNYVAPPPIDLYDHDYDYRADDCDHSNVSPTRMRKVGKLLSELFTSSFKLAVPSLFRGMVQNLQDQVLRDKLMSFIDHSFPPDLIQSMASDPSTREGIKNQIRIACEDELGDVVLRLSTEDCFDLVCDLAVRHGRDIKMWGPPCACSFARCLPCLERLVQSINTTPPTPPADIKPIRPDELHRWVEELIDNDWMDEDWETKDWKPRVTKAWETMADILWETASEIDPLALHRVQDAYDALAKMDGLSLYYSVLTREVTALDCSDGGTHAGAAGRDSREQRMAPCDAKGTKMSSPAGSFPSLSPYFARMKSEVKKLHSRNAELVETQAAAATANGRPKEAKAIIKAWEQEKEDDTGKDLRKTLARVVREQGNAAYSAGSYAVAVEHYTRAIGYDASEAIYPLNRAACLLKLKRFPDAERDCTAAIALDATNHKAYFRRGVSRAGMGREVEAREDFEEVLKLQKTNPEAREELRKLSEQFLNAKPPAPAPAPGKARASDAESTHDHAPAPIPAVKSVKSPSTRQKKLLPPQAPMSVSQSDTKDFAQAADQSGKTMSATFNLGKIQGFTHKDTLAALAGLGLSGPAKDEADAYLRNIVQKAGLAQLRSVIGAAAAGQYDMDGGQSGDTTIINQQAAQKLLDFMKRNPHLQLEGLTVTTAVEGDYEGSEEFEDDEDEEWEDSSEGDGDQNTDADRVRRHINDLLPCCDNDCEAHRDAHLHSPCSTQVASTGLPASDQPSWHSDPPRTSIASHTTASSAETSAGSAASSSSPRRKSHALSTDSPDRPKRSIVRTPPTSESEDDAHTVERTSKGNSTASLAPPVESQLSDREHHDAISQLSQQICFAIVFGYIVATQHPDEVEQSLRMPPGWPDASVLAGLGRRYGPSGVMSSVMKRAMASTKLSDLVPSADQPQSGRSPAQSSAASRLSDLPTSQASKQGQPTMHAADDHFVKALDYVMKIGGWASPSIDAGSH